MESSPPTDKVNNNTRGRRNLRVPSHAASLCARGFVVLLGTGALFCSIYTAMTCRFFSFRTLDGEPWEGLAPPFDQSAHSSVGFFKYSLTEPDKNEGLTFLNKECSTYDDWGDVGQNIYFYISQWCSLAAAVAGFLAWVSNVSEVMCCKFFGSRPLTLVLFVVAAVLQCGTFLIFGDDQFCLDAASQNQCRIGIGAWSSLCAALAFFIASVVVCFFNQFEPQFTNRCSRATKPGDSDIPTDDDHSNDNGEAPPTPVSSAENEELTMDSGIIRNTTDDTGDVGDANGDADEEMTRDPPESRANEDETTYVSGDDYTEVKTNGDMEDRTQISSYPSDTQDDGYESETTYNTPKNVLDDMIDAADAAVSTRTWDRHGGRDSTFFDMCCADPFQHVESMKIRRTPKRKRYSLGKSHKYNQRVHFGP